MEKKWPSQNFCAVNYGRQKDTFLLFLYKKNKLHHFFLEFLVIGSDWTILIFFFLQILIIPYTILNL